MKSTSHHAYPYSSLPPSKPTSSASPLADLPKTLHEKSASKDPSKAHSNHQILTSVYPFPPAKPSPLTSSHGNSSNRCTATAALSIGFFTTALMAERLLHRSLRRWRCFSQKLGSGTGIPALTGRLRGKEGLFSPEMSTEKVCCGRWEEVRLVKRWSGKSKGRFG